MVDRAVAALWFHKLKGSTHSPDQLHGSLTMLPEHVCCAATSAGWAEMAAGSELGRDVKVNAVIGKRYRAAPAESPSTRKISDSARSVDVQSASFPGSVDFCSTPFRRTSSRAFLAASAALNACCVQRLHGLNSLRHRWHGGTGRCQLEEMAAVFSQGLLQHHMLCIEGHPSGVL